MQPLHPPAQAGGEVAHQLLAGDGRVHRGEPAHQRHDLDVAPAAVVELSSQLQAWMAFEAAFRVTDGLPAVPESLKSPPALT